MTLSFIFGARSDTTVVRRMWRVDPPRARWDRFLMRCVLPLALGVAISGGCGWYRREPADAGRNRAGKRRRHLPARDHGALAALRRIALRRSVPVPPVQDRRGRWGRRTRDPISLSIPDGGWPSGTKRWPPPLQHLI